MKGILIFLFFIILLSGLVQAQDTAMVNRIKTSVPFIDGVIGDDEWKDSNVYYGDYWLNRLNWRTRFSVSTKDFFEYRILYDDNFIYFGIKIHDPVPHPYVYPICTKRVSNKPFDTFKIAFDQGNDSLTGGGTRDYKIVENKDYMVTNFVGDSPIKKKISCAQFKWSDIFNKVVPHWISWRLCPSGGDLIGTFEYNEDHWEWEVRMPYNKEGWININPETDILGMLLTYTNNDGTSLRAYIDCIRKEYNQSYFNSPNVEVHGSYPKINCDEIVFCGEEQRETEKWLSLEFEEFEGDIPKPSPMSLIDIINKIIDWIKNFLGL